MVAGNLVKVRRALSALPRRTRCADFGVLSGAIALVSGSGVLDRLVPPWVAYDYARTLRGRSAPVPSLVDVPHAGHFDLVTPSTPAWREVSALVEQALEP